MQQEGYVAKISMCMDKTENKKHKEKLRNTIVNAILQSTKLNIFITVYSGSIF